jgi:hypothetical protein
MIVSSRPFRMLLISLLKYLSTVEVLHLEISLPSESSLDYVQKSRYQSRDISGIISARRTSLISPLLK